MKNLDYGNGTRLWDAVGASLDELKGVEGRRVILVFTDGDDTVEQAEPGHGHRSRARRGSDDLRDRPREQLLQRPAAWCGRKPDGGLRKIADETGGGYFELKKTSELAPTFTKVAQELHSQYVIGFAPTLLDNKVHKLAVKMKQPGMTARARRSYLAAADKIVELGEVGG